MSVRPISIPYATDTQCHICLTNPFDDDPTMNTHTWNGHSMVSGSGTEAERKIIHGICSRCLPDVPRNQKLLKCFVCKMSFPDQRRSEIVVRRDGSLISETLLPPSNGGNRIAPPVRNAAGPQEGFRARHPGWEAAVGETEFVGAMVSLVGGMVTFVVSVVASSSTITTIVIPSAHVAVQVTAWTTTALVATAALPIVLGISLGAAGVVASIAMFEPVFRIADMIMHEH
ncbi:MAG: hypothetical protein NTX49_08910 [Chlamydiae bacterium]|nr:hypothetical protein [Chlamydiota bacterium]